jgi:hypothetical protein
LPEVGENLQDHPVTLSDFKLKPGIMTLGMSLFGASNWGSDTHDKIRLQTQRSPQNSKCCCELCYVNVHLLVHLTYFCSEANQAGVFTYSVGNIGTVTLQSMTTPSEFKAMRDSLDQDLAERILTPLQKAQYQHLKDLVDGGEEGWVEIVVVPSGGVLSPPKPGENYLTAVAIQQVRDFSFPLVQCHIDFLLQ